MYRDRPAGWAGRMHRFRCSTSPTFMPVLWRNGRWTTLHEKKFVVPGLMAGRLHRHPAARYHVGHRF
ncbi:MAG: hypothetical protein KDJ22_02300 [Candidatus Competibacteraceae bacterium]|nr:hypothetical protein [Candidatus Competibacteraceae bacterium]MCP5124889.1 hypothetical protein [Gammaproteobacteria bacterium]HRX71003.1 hypothetical protein [Candidatus Competibacteraceae bacterium]